MASIIIPSSEWVEKFRLKQTRFLHLRTDWLKVKVAQLANQMIIDPIVEEMKRMGVSEKIYRNVKLLTPTITPKNIFLRVHSEFFAENGFDVALAREKGTDQDNGGKHWIRPKEKKALKWIEQGNARFSGGHQVSGLPRLNIIQKTIERKQYDLQQKLNEAFTDWKESLNS